MIKKDTPQSLKSNLARRQKEKSENSRERSAEQLFADLKSVASTVEGSDFGPTEDASEPTARCICDAKKGQLVTRSGLPRFRCCVCHLHHKRAMNSPAAVGDFFGTVLQQVCHFKVDVIAGDANAAAHTSTIKEPSSAQFLSCRHAKRDAT